MACTAVIDVISQTIIGKYTPMPAGFPFPSPDPTPQEGQVAVVIPDNLSWQCVDAVTLSENGDWIFTENQDTKDQYLRGLRQERNNRLAECDWTQLTDAPVNREAWAAYRQNLRDLPDVTVNPASPIWPEKPN